MKEVNVKTSIGEFTLKKPNAGAMNKATMEADMGGGVIKFTKWMYELIPLMITKHPFGIIPLENQAETLKKKLDDMEAYEDYNLLTTAARGLVKFEKGDAQKKSEKPSSSEESPVKDGSVPPS